MWPAWVCVHEHLRRDRRVAAPKHLSDAAAEHLSLARAGAQPQSQRRCSRTSRTRRRRPPTARPTAHPPSPTAQPHRLLTRLKTSRRPPTTRPPAESPPSRPPSRRRRAPASRHPPNACHPPADARHRAPACYRPARPNRRRTCPPTLPAELPAGCPPRPLPARPSGHPPAETPPSRLPPPARHQHSRLCTECGAELVLSAALTLSNSQNAFFLNTRWALRSR